MTTFTFDNRWDVIVGKLKQRYGQLADDDLTFAEGKGEELLARLRERLGISPEDLDNVLNEVHFEVAGQKDSAQEKVGVAADAVRKTAAAAANVVKEQAAEAYDRTRAQTRTLWEDGEGYVRENPRQSMLAAVFAGFIAGLLIRERW